MGTSSVAKGAAKTAAKQIIKAEAKQAVKQEAKQLVKQEIKQEAKTVTEGAVKKFGCFVMGTLVWVQGDSAIAIDKVKADMYVNAYDVSNQIQVIKKVQQAFFSAEFLYGIVRWLRTLRPIITCQSNLYPSVSYNLLPKDTLGRGKVCDHRFILSYYKYNKTRS